MQFTRVFVMMADRTGGEIVGDPMALAGALQRLESLAKGN